MDDTKKSVGPSRDVTTAAKRRFMPSSTAAEALKRFHLLPAQVERFVPALPWVVAGVTLVAPLVAVTDLMFFTGLASATVASFLVVMLGPATRRALEVVWTGKVLTPRGALPPDEAFASFVDRFRCQLNSVVGSVVVAVAFAVFATPQFFLLVPEAERGGSGFDLGRVAAIVGGWPPLRTAGIALTAVLGLALGAFAWRMGVIGEYIFRLGREFNTVLQSGHPDRAGGTAPLGSLCFHNALVVSVPSVFLGVWRTLIATVPEVRARYGYLEGWFTVLLAVTVVLALVGFILPLYSVHRTMERERDARRKTVERMNSKLADLAAKIRSAAEEGRSDELAKFKQEHEILSQVYVRERDLPTWPVDPTVVRGYVISQVVPLLSLSKVADAIATRFFKT